MGITTPTSDSAAVTTDPNNPTTSASLSLSIRMLFTAVNPNKVGIKYGESKFTVMYRGIPLGEASVPGFYQEAHSVRQVAATIAVDRINLQQADAADLVRDASLNDRVELRVLGDVGAKIRVMNFDSPGVQVSVDCAIVISPRKQSLTYKQCGFDGLSKKKQHLDDHPARTTSKAPVKTPPRPSGGIVILEPVSDTQPAAPSGTEVASSSQAVPNWQPTFMLGGAPLRATTSVKIWAQGEGGRVAESLTAPLTHILGERASELVEDAEQEKALKEVAIDTDRDKVKEAEIPCLAVALPVQSQVEAADDKDTPSMKALVEAINTHIENPDMEATSNLNAPGHAENQRPTTEDAAGQISDDIVQLFQTNLAV
nr:hypothetical protein CFP56_55158 [Quercus suber]